MATSAEPRVFASIEDAIEDVRNGKFVVVVDDPDRENEGDLVVAAQFATPEAINFMATHARGLICLCLTEERCDELGLRQMTEHNEAPLGTAFTVVGRGSRGRDHGHLRRRPLADDPGRNRPQVDAARPRHARSRLPAPRARRRRASSAPARPRRRSTSRGSPA